MVPGVAIFSYRLDYEIETDQKYTGIFESYSRLELKVFPVGKNSTANLIRTIQKEL